MDLNGILIHCMHSFERNDQAWKEDVSIFTPSLTDSCLSRQSAHRCLSVSLLLGLFLGPRIKSLTQLSKKKGNVIAQAFDQGSRFSSVFSADIYVCLLNLIEFNHIPVTGLVLTHSWDWGQSPLPWSAWPGDRDGNCKPELLWWAERALGGPPMMSVVIHPMFSHKQNRKNHVTFNGQWKSLSVEWSVNWKIEDLSQDTLFFP